MNYEIKKTSHVTITFLKSIRQHIGAGEWWKAIFELSQVIHRESSLKINQRQADEFGAVLGAISQKLIDAQVNRLDRRLKSALRRAHHEPKAKARAKAKRAAARKPSAAGWLHAKRKALGLENLSILAVNLMQALNHHVSITRSKHDKLTAYGHGIGTEKDWDFYGKRCRFPLKYDYATVHAHVGEAPWREKKPTVSIHVCSSTGKMHRFSVPALATTLYGVDDYYVKEGHHWRGYDLTPNRETFSLPAGYMVFNAHEQGRPDVYAAGHGKTLEDARKDAASKKMQWIIEKNAQKEALKKKAASEAAKAKDKAMFERWLALKKTQKLGVCAADAIAAKCCRYGTARFIERHLPGHEDVVEVLKTGSDAGAAMQQCIITIGELAKFLDTPTYGSFIFNILNYKRCLEVYKNSKKEIPA